MIGRYRIIKLILLLLFLTPVLMPVFTYASEKKKIAVLDFVNAGPYERLNYLKYLLPQILISGLVGQEGIAVLKRHHLQPLIGEETLAEEGLLEDKPFTPEEADIIIEGSWAEQPKPGLSFEETPIVIKALVRGVRSKKILGEVKVQGKKQEFARIQRELISGILSVISGKKSSGKEVKKVVSSWEATEYLGRGISIMQFSVPLPKLRRAVEFFKRALYLDPENPLIFEKIASCYWTMYWGNIYTQNRGDKVKIEGLLGAVEWNGRIIDKFWQDPVVAPRAMRQLMSAYAWAVLKETGMDDQFKERFLKRLQQCVGPFVQRYGYNVDVGNALRLAGRAGLYTTRSQYAANDFQKTALKYAVQAYRQCIEHSAQIGFSDKPGPLITELLLPSNLAEALRKLNRTEEAIREIEQAIKRNPDSQYVPDLHAEAADFSFYRRYKNYKLAKKHFALAIKAAERLKIDETSLSWGFAVYYLMDKIIDDPSSSDLLKHEAFELKIRTIRENLPRLVRFLQGHAQSYPPAAQKLREVLKDYAPNGDRPFDDQRNLILWTRPVWTGYKYRPGISASLRRGKVVWLATHPDSRSKKLSLWRLNLNTGAASGYSSWSEAIDAGLKVTALEESKGRFFIGTTDGLFIVNRNKEWKRISPEDGLPLREITGLAIDKDSLWVACGTLRSHFYGVHSIIDKKALCRYVWEEGTFETYPISALPTAIYSDKNNLWVGVWGGGIYRMDKETGKYIEIRPPKPKSFDYVKMFVDEGDKIWCSMYNETLLIKKATSKTLYSTKKGTNYIVRDGWHYWLASEGPVRINREESTSGPSYPILKDLSKSPTAVYPTAEYIWVVRGRQVRGLRREALSLSAEVLKQIAIAYRLKRIDPQLAAEALEKLKKTLPKSAGLRLEIADSYRIMVSTAKYEKDGYAAELRKHLELYRQKWEEALREAYELAPESALVLDTIKEAEGDYHLKVLDKKMKMRRN